MVKTCTVQVKPNFKIYTINMYYPIKINPKHTKILKDINKVL